MIDPLMASIRNRQQERPRTGKWVRPVKALPTSYRFRCSVCGGLVYDVAGSRRRTNKEGVTRCSYKFCPRCGARME